MFKCCPYCHRWILRWLYTRHEMKHTALRADGQMVDHMTAPPEKRYTGSLDGVPQSYLHPKCGVTTGMPEDIIRTYLIHPLSYADGSFCCGCSTYVKSWELIWTETNENVLSYMARRRLEFLRNELRMNVPDRPTELILTPRAARIIQEYLFTKVGPSACCTLILPQSAVEDIEMGGAERVDLKTQIAVTASGVTFAIRKQDVASLPGVVIDYNTTLEGFCVCRLYPPVA